MEYLVPGVFALQGVLVLWVLGLWSKARGFLEREETVVQNLLAHKVEETLGLFVGEKAHSLSLARLQDLNAACALGGPGALLDQSALDDEVEASIESLIRPIRSAGSMAVLLGLLGTVFGLSQGVIRLVNGVTNLTSGGASQRRIDSDKVSALVAEVAKSLQSFGNAFNSTMAGVCLALGCLYLGEVLDKHFARFMEQFRKCSRLRLAPNTDFGTARYDLVKQLHGLQEAIVHLQKRMPNLEDYANANARMNNLVEQMEVSTKSVMEAMDRTAGELNKPSQVTGVLNRVELLIEQFVKETKQTLADAVKGIPELSNKQVEVAEALIRQVGDTPGEVTASRTAFEDLLKRLQATSEKMDRLLEARAAQLASMQPPPVIQQPKIRGLWRWLFYSGGA